MDKLTRGSIIKISNGEKVSDPVLQIIHIQPMTRKQSAMDRFIVILSDGRFHMEGISTSSFALSIKSGRLKNFAVVKLEEYTVNTAKNGKKIVVVLKGEIIDDSISCEIGTSVSYKEHTETKPFSAGNSITKKEIPMRKMDKTSSIEEPAKRARTNTVNSELDEIEQNVVPVSALTQYRGRWAIKVRCTSKSNVRSWQKPTSSGKLMSLDLLDDEGTEIRATLFNDAVDAFENVFQEGNVYLISRGRVKLANKKFTHIRNDYEITLDIDSLVRIVPDDSRIQSSLYQFSPLSALQNADENSFVDVLAVVARVDAMSSIMSSKQNRFIDKRNILLSDKNASVELTVWGDQAVNLNEESLQGNPIVSIKAARVSHFNGRSLSLTNNSKISVDPDLPEVYELKTWWDQGGKNAPTTSLSAQSSGASISASEPRLLLEDVKHQQLGSKADGSADLFVTKATIMSVRHDFAKPPFYYACTKMRDGRTCNKKASKAGGGTDDQFWCEVCNCATEANPRFILNFTLGDHSGAVFANCFDEVGQKIIGCKAAEIATFCEGPMANEMKFSEMFLRSSFSTKLFKIKAKSETYLDEERVRCTVMAVQDLDYVFESTKLLEKINLLE